MPAGNMDPTRPVLERSDLAESAREPLDSHEGEGFGSYYPGPLTDDEEATLLDTTDATNIPDDDVTPEDRDNRPHADVRQTELSGHTDPWPNESTRDFRREPGT